jgi:hypothetical protein
VRSSTSFYAPSVLYDTVRLVDRVGAYGDNTFLEALGWLRSLPASG